MFCDAHFNTEDATLMELVTSSYKQNTIKLSLIVLMEMEILWADIYISN